MAGDAQQSGVKRVYRARLKGHQRDGRTAWKERGCGAVPQTACRDDGRLYQKICEQKGNRGEGLSVRLHHGIKICAAGGRTAGTGQEKLCCQHPQKRAADGIFCDGASAAASGGRGRAEACL